MIYYESVGNYIKAAQGELAKIQALETLITTLLDTTLVAALDPSTATTQELMLNDGQSIVKTIYRDPGELIGYVKQLDNLKQLYKNRLQGRTQQLKSSDNFIYSNWPYGVF